jgi:NAD(P)-dependent dehydrogenase (short-subunit alcohol dehydrogenase family)
VADWDLSGRVVLITGGGSGIGAATARELVRRGAASVLADVDADGLAATAASMTPAPLTVVLDVVDQAACEAAVAGALAYHDRLDAVWANAGIGSLAPLESVEPAVWTRVIEVNLLGTFRTVRAALPAIVASRGYVAVTASLASFAHSPGMSAYCASKAGLEAMCNSLRLEVAHKGVEVGTIHPTWIDTPMVREGDAESRAFRRLRESMSPPFRKTYPVERAARDIADGFERRARRIYSPGFVRAAHVLRAAMTTRPFERDAVQAAPDIVRIFEDEVAQRGAVAASLTGRARRRLEDSSRAASSQLPDAGTPADAADRAHSHSDE